MPALLMFALLVACGDRSTAAPGTPAVPGSEAGPRAVSPEAVATGGDLYATRCAGCHGVDGSGGPGSPIRDVVRRRGDAEIVGVIQEGTGRMPPVRLSDAEAAAVVAWMRGSFGG